MQMTAKSFEKAQPTPHKFKCSFIGQITSPMCTIAPLPPSGPGKSPAVTLVPEVSVNSRDRPFLQNWAKGRCTDIYEAPTPIPPGPGSPAYVFSLIPNTPLRSRRVPCYRCVFAQSNTARQERPALNSASVQIQIHPFLLPPRGIRVKGKSCTSWATWK